MEQRTPQHGSDQAVRPLGASIPGGLGPHYRVQTLAPDGHSWVKHSLFRSAQDAEGCAQGLIATGAEARVVKYVGCATGS